MIQPHEQCALRLFRLIAAPGRSFSKQGVWSARDGSNRAYRDIIMDLQKKGVLKYNNTSVTLLK